jgi:hypothetical protein
MDPAAADTAGPRGVGKATNGCTKIKYDAYRMHARLNRGPVKLLTRTGLDRTHKYTGPPLRPARPISTANRAARLQSGKKHAVHPDTRSELKPLDPVSRLG